MKRSTFFYWIAGLAILGLILVASFYFDDAVRHFVGRHQERTLRKFMVNISRVGDWPAHLGLGLVLIGIAWWRGNKNWTRIFLSMLIAMTLAGVVARGIKIATARARPSVRTEEVKSRFSEKYHAFPSGHVAASMAFFGVLLIVRRRVGLVCLSIPIVIGFSRIYVRAHYLSDVVCAAILGLLCAFLVARWLLLKSTISHQTSNI